MRTSLDLYREDPEFSVSVEGGRDTVKEPDELHSFHERVQTIVDKLLIEKQGDDNNKGLVNGNSVSELSVVQVTLDGTCTVSAMTRDIILEQYLGSVPKSMTIGIEKGTRRFVGGEEFENTLKSRDTRILESSYPDSKDAAFIVRKCSVLVNLPPIRCVILYDRCLLVVSEGNEEILKEVVPKMRDFVINKAGPFEMKVLEAVLSLTNATIRNDVESLRTSVGACVTNVMSERATGLNRLRVAKSNVAKLSTRIQSIQNAYVEVLNSDESMALMNLTKVYNKPDAYVAAKVAVWEGDHDDVELLLESSLQSVDGSMSQVQEFDQDLEVATDVLTIKLDTARNNLLKVDLMVSCVTSVAAVGALIAGIFGMNLESSIQNSPNWFWSLTGVLTFGSLTTVVVMFTLIKRRGWLAS